jgi:hypothetical protein
LIFSQPPDVVFGNTKPTPATVQPGILVIADSLVENQWPKSLKFVNAPTDQQSLMPSQCVRFGIVATGDDRDELLQNSKRSFEIKFAGQSKVLLPESAAMIKQVKPEGWDFVANGLSVAGIRNTLFSSASLAVSNAGWCVPPNTQDGTANITGNVAAVAGKNVSLRSRSIQVTTLETARKRSPFKDEQSFSAWLQHYHSSPDPAQLLPGIRFVAAREKWTVMPNVAIFFVEALKAYPSACNELLQRVAREDRAFLCDAAVVSSRILDRRQLGTPHHRGTGKHKLASASGCI